MQKKTAALVAGTAALFALAASPLALADSVFIPIGPVTDMQIGQTSTAVPPTRVATPTTLGTPVAVPAIRGATN
jgi:hypothetical protein